MKIRAFAFAILIYLPWYLFQKFVIPSNDRLLKYHLAGNQNRSDTPFLEVLVESYRSITPGTFITYRFENLWQVLGNSHSDFFRAILPSISQEQAFLSLGAAILHSSFGLILPGIFFIAIASSRLKQITTFWKSILSVVFLSYAIWILVMFDPDNLPDLCFK